MKSLFLAGLCLGLFFSLPVQGQPCVLGAVTLDADFPGGNMGQCEASRKRLVLKLKPEDWPINPSPWYSFRLTGVGKLEVELDYGRARHRYRPKVSEDGQTWRLLDAGSVRSMRDGRRVRMKLQVDGEIFVSAQELMTSAWYDTWLSGLVQQYPGLERRTFGHSKAGRPLWVVETNPQAANTVFMVGRQHPPEITGAMAMVAYVETLLQGHPQHCQTTSDLCRFYANTNLVFAPLLNPDGVDLGHWRHSLGGLDINRDWGPFTQPETQAIKRLIDQLDQRSTLRAFFDFHSTQRNLFYIQEDEDLTLPPGFSRRWLANAEARGIYDYTPEPRHNRGSPTSKNYMYARFGIPSITYEVGDRTQRDDIRDAAEKLALAMVDELYPFVREYDVALVNGTVVDGLGGPPRRAHVGIVGRHIAYIGDQPIQAKSVIDAAGLIVSPGFIDPHTHADADLEKPGTAANLPYLHQGVTTVVIGNDGGGELPARQIRSLQTGRLGTNVGLLVGHGWLRAQHVGRRDVTASAEQLDAMRDALEEGMRDGALGLSSGLFYAPGSYADTAEVVELAKVAAAHHGYYDTHMRDEGNYGEGLLASVDETIKIGRQASIPVHIAHIKALGPAVHGLSEQVVARVAAARADGVQVTADQYPWLASGTRLSNALLPRWVQDGGRQAMRKRLREPLDGPLLEQMNANLARRGGGERLLITGESAHRGRTLKEVAAITERTELQAAVEIILSGDPAIASFMMNERDVERFAAQPWVVTGSDGSRGHPRKYASFPKRYQDAVVNGGVPLGEFVKQSSARTADIIGLCDRGRLITGRVADIAIWDADAFAPTATYEQPTSLATGVVHLFVEGEAVITQGKPTGVTPGRVVRRQACRG